MGREPDTVVRLRSAESLVERLVLTLRDLGCHGYVARFDAALRGAATGTELHLGVRGALRDLLAEDGCHGECRRLAEAALAAIDRRLYAPPQAAPALARTHPPARRLAGWAAGRLRAVLARAWRW